MIILYSASKSAFLAYRFVHPAQLLSHSVTLTEHIGALAEMALAVMCAVGGRIIEQGVEQN